MSATEQQIVWGFLHILAQPDRLEGNWGTSYDNSKWDIDTDTYINGVVMTIDLDFYMGWLLEIADRDTKVVSYMAVVAYHGPKTFVDTTEDGKPYTYIVAWDHDFQWMPGLAGQFFSRNVTYDEACAWAVGAIFGMIDSHDEAKRRTR